MNKAPDGTDEWLKRELVLAPCAEFIGNRLLTIDLLRRKRLLFYPVSLRGASIGGVATQTCLPRAPGWFKGIQEEVGLRAKSDHQL